MDEGSQCSAVAIKFKIKELIQREDRTHALSDLEIAKKLKALGIGVARRTVAKYREALHILPSYIRQRDSELA